MSRWIWICFVVVLLGGIAIYSSEGRALSVRPTMVQVGEIRTYVEERGRTRLPTIYRVTMPLRGRIQPITFQEGDTVSAGTEVAQLDPADLDTELAESEAQVGQFDQVLLSLRKTIQAAQAQVKAAGAKLEFAEGEMKRKNALKVTNAISESDIREAELLEIESRIDLEQDSLTVLAIDALRSALTIGRDDAEEQRKRRSRDRDRASLFSPVDGVVLKRHVWNERVLPEGEVLLEIGRLEDLEVEADVLTQDATAITVGSAVDIEGSAIGAEPIRGTVARIFPQGFMKVSSLGVEQQRVRVIIKFDADDLNRLRAQGSTLGVDYRVRVKIYTAEKTDALTVDRSAVFRGPTGDWEAFVIRKGRARKVRLEVGLSNDFKVEILSGLEAGDRVIPAPDSSITDGRRVDSRQMAKKGL